MQVGWIYGSVTEDILTGFKMHCHGWRSVYCIPKRPAFKGSAPINLSDRLHQVLRWALGSVEILLSRHCPIWYGYGCGLKWLERFSYINSVVYPLTSIPLIAYCTLPAVCLLTGQFIVPEVTTIPTSECIRIFSICQVCSAEWDMFFVWCAAKQLCQYNFHGPFHLYSSDRYPRNAVGRSRDPRLVEKRTVLGYWGCLVPPFCTFPGSAKGFGWC